MQLVISDPKTGKAYPKKAGEPAYFFDKKIGEQVSLQSVGLEGFEAQIMGGSDYQGFPMKKHLVGTTRGSNFVTKNKKEGLRIRITQRGGMVSKETAQLNLRITKYGNKNIEDILTPDKKGGKKSAKEELVEASLKAAGTQTAAEEMAKAEFKKGEGRK